VLRDVLGIATDAGEDVRRDRVLEDQADEVEPRLGLDDAALVPRLPVLVEDREVDPREVLPEARAPDDVRDVEHPVVVQERQAVSQPDDPSDPVRAGLRQLLRLGADERILARVRPELPPDRVALVEHAVPEQAK